MNICIKKKTQTLKRGWLENNFASMCLAVF